MKETQITSNVLTRKEAAAYLTVSRGTLDKLGIPFIQIRRRVVYRKADLDAWLERQATGAKSPGRKNPGKKSGAKNQAQKTRKVTA